MVNYGPYVLYYERLTCAAPFSATSSTWQVYTLKSPFNRMVVPLSTSPQPWLLLPPVSLLYSLRVSKSVHFGNGGCVSWLTVAAEWLEPALLLASVWSEESAITNVRAIQLLASNFLVECVFLQKSVSPSPFFFAHWRGVVLNHVTKFLRFRKICLLDL